MVVVTAILAGVNDRLFGEGRRYLVRGGDNTLTGGDDQFWIAAAET